jgi:hypothetical protein
MSLNDGLPFLARFITYDGKCALCGERSEFSSWCYVKRRTVANDETCESFKEKMKA